jgi:hypothetical protein
VNILARTWRFVTLMLAALTTGMAFCHLMELPAKMRYDAQAYLTVQQTYPYFGTVGAVLEPGSIAAAAVLCFLVRKQRPSFWLTLAGTLLLAAALAAWFTFVAPMNAELATWAPESIPADWTDVRDQWEYAHAARAILQIAGLGALFLSVVVETSTERVRDRAFSPRSVANSASPNRPAASGSRGTSDDGAGAASRSIRNDLPRMTDAAITSAN